MYFVAEGDDFDVAGTAFVAAGIAGLLLFMFLLFLVAVEAAVLETSTVDGILLGAGFRWAEAAS